MIEVLAEIAGSVFKVEKNVDEGVEAEDVLLILESMKMEIPVKAPKAGIIAKVEVAQGDAVARGDTLIALEED